MNKLVNRTPKESRAGVVTPWFHPADKPSPTRLDETAGLVRALGCELAFARPEQVRRILPSHLMPKGILERIHNDLQAQACNLLVVDGTLSPVQQRNLERRLDIKVIDRTGLILEIFGLRARTKEGRLQVELARLLYERSRLVRTWTHLERQRGGRGFLSGPGESQLEADKRMLDRTLKSLRSDLDDVRRTRRLQRLGRSRSGVPVIAFVGYTNAGKSSLFNTLSGAAVLAKDMPFATLDPTIRRLDLPGIGDTAVVDTVGFITDLPTHLIESFQATLEEAMEADLLVHVRDRSSEDDLHQKQDVEAVLEALQEQAGQQLPPMIEAWNKVDLLSAEDRNRLEGSTKNGTPTPSVLISALTGEGVDDLVELIVQKLRASAVSAHVRLPPDQGAARSWLHEHSHVEHEEIVDDSGHMILHVSFSLSEFGRFQTMFPNIALDTADPG